MLHKFYSKAVLIVLLDLRYLQYALLEAGAVFLFFNPGNTKTQTPMAALKDDLNHFKTLHSAFLTPATDPAFVRAC
jgi:hypothetical protein